MFLSHRNSEAGVGAPWTQPPTPLQLTPAPRVPERPGPCGTPHWWCLRAWLSLLCLWLFLSRSIIKIQLKEASVKNKFLIKIFNEQESDHISSHGALIYAGLLAALQPHFLVRFALLHMDLGPLFIWAKPNNSCHSTSFKLSSFWFIFSKKCKWLHLL